jgi:hypothetical protein
MTTCKICGHFWTGLVDCPVCQPWGIKELKKWVDWELLNTRRSSTANLAIIKELEKRIDKITIELRAALNDFLDRLEQKLTDEIQTNILEETRSQIRKTRKQELDSMRDN